MYKNYVYKKESDIQREKDLVKIFDLCRYSEKHVNNAICPLLNSRCKKDSCPLFYCVNVRDCDKAADICLDRGGFYKNIY